MRRGIAGDMHFVDARRDDLAILDNDRAEWPATVLDIGVGKFDGLTQETIRVHECFLPVPCSQDTSINFHSEIKC
jgi:hypothetical protein